MSSAAAEKSSLADAVNSHSNPSSFSGAYNPNALSKKNNNLLVLNCLYILLAVMIYSTHSHMATFISDIWQMNRLESYRANFFQIFNFFGAILFGYVADKTGKYRVLLAGCAGGYCVSMFLLIFPLFMHPDLLRYKLANYYFLHACSAVSVSGLVPIVDTLVLKELKALNTNLFAFGYSRLWFAVGRFCVSFLIIHTSSFLEIKGYFIMFYFLILSTLAFIITVMLRIKDGDPAINSAINAHAPDYNNNDREKEKIHQDSTYLRTAKSNLRSKNSPKILNSNFVFLLLTVFVTGFIHTCLVIYKYTYLFVELDLKKSSYQSHFYLLTPLSEIVGFFCSTHAIRWLGPYWILICAMIVGMARVMGYVSLTTDFLNDPASENMAYYTLFILEFLHGITLSFGRPSASIITFEMAPTSSVFTAMGWMIGVLQGFCCFIFTTSAYFLIIYCYFSIKLFFILSSVVCAIFTIIAIIKFAVIDRVIFTTNAKKPTSLVAKLEI